jgi:hypothetical protein
MPEPHAAPARGQMDDLVGVVPLDRVHAQRRNRFDFIDWDNSIKR